MSIPSEKRAARRYALALIAADPMAGVLPSVAAAARPVVRIPGYPHLEESYRFAELVFPLLGKGKAVKELAVRGTFDEVIASANLPRKLA